MKISFLLIINPIIALLVSLLFYFAFNSVYNIDIQEAATIHIGLVLFLIFVIPFYTLTIVLLHFQKRSFAMISFLAHVFIAVSLVFYLIDIHFLSVHLPIEIVKSLMISFVMIGLISLYCVFGFYWNSIKDKAYIKTRL